MPEYLAPGVFVEEVSFRSKSIEGVPTSTTGMAGLAAYGPVYFLGGPGSCEPRLITSFTEFERVYGGLDLLRIGATPPGDERTPYLAHAVRSFFENGGKRVYISRVYLPRDDSDPNDGIASRPVSINGGVDEAQWRARWPGDAGNVYVSVEVTRSKNLLYLNDDFGRQAQRVKAGAVVEIIPAGDPVPDGNDALVESQLRVVEVDLEGRQSFIDNSGASSPPVDDGDVIQLVELAVSISVNSERLDQYAELAAHPNQKRYVGRILELDDPEADSPVWFDWDPESASSVAAFLPAYIMMGLQSNVNGRLQNGHDGGLPLPSDFGGKPADLDFPNVKATGLEALAEIDDIAIVAMPDTGDMGDETLSRVAAQKLVTHAEKMRYRIAIIDPPINSSINKVRDFRGQFDSKYAAVYYPWIKIFDPNERVSQGAPPKQLLLPPSGSVAGIYARNDITRGVHKAPANEIIRGLTKFEVNINKPRQEVINPEGINALRFFEGRGYRVWGARTMSSDPEWKYVNVRRLFIYIEHSIDNDTQWAVFEPNNRRLWSNIRRTIEDFLLVLWRDGALLGDKPEDAFFVRCDRTTMTQNDLDNGRLICLVGVAPVKPAEFVIFRIGQWTSDSKV